MASTPLKVIVVGAGFGGLTAAIECRLRGMEVSLIETYPTSLAYGDIIDFFPNGGRIIENWEDGRVARDLMKICINQADRLKYCKADGTLIYEEDWILEPHHYWKTYGGHRGQMHKVILDYAEEIGVKLEFGNKVAQYIDGDRPSVITTKGKKYVADVVVAADGPRSIARQQVLGLPDTRVNSGYAIFRSYINLTEEHAKNPYLKDFCNPTVDDTLLWTAKDLHAIIYTWNKGKDLGWVLTHKDTADIGESWSFPAKKQDVLDCLKEGKFEQRLVEVVKATEEKNIVDYKLVWREPLTTWLSPSAHICLIGDAAHCHLPTSAQGGSQAMEDGVALAIALHRAKGDVALGLRVFERIRFNRSHVTHQASISVRDNLHNVEADADFIKKNPHVIALPRPDWVIEYDIYAESEKHFDHLAADVKSGREGTIEELSLPAGGDYSPDSLKHKAKRVPRSRL